MKYGAKKDANHGEIVTAMDACGLPFIDLSTMGRGVPDGLTCLGKQMYFVEIKNPKTGYGRRGLNPIQKKWADQWRGLSICIFRSIDDVQKFAAGKLSEIEVIECGAAWKVAA